MNTETISIKKLKPNPANPRTIRDDKFHKLVQSVKDFPQMLEIRPIVVNDQLEVLGGNMRLRACIEAGMKEVTIIRASELTEDQQRRFIVVDNVGFGEFDMDALANEWDAEELQEWGVDVWQSQPEIDYSILDGEDVSGQLEDMANGVKKAIQIEFYAEDYEKAFELVKFWRTKGTYVGGMIMEHLESEKEKQ